MALKDLYGGVGANAKVAIASRNDIQELYYAGKNKPHMWWDEFEIRLTNVFAIIGKDAGCQIHTNESKLSLLNKNVPDDSLNTMKTTIEMQMRATPMTMTYCSALANYRNNFNQRCPNESTVKRNNRRTQKIYSHGGR